MSTNSFSFSQLSTYLSCGKKYEFAYITKLPQAMTWAAAFWTSIHNTLYKYFQRIQKNQQSPSLFDVHNEDVSLEALLNIYDKSWVSAWYSDTKEEEKRYDEWLGVLKDFYNKWDFWNPLLLEKSFKLQIDDFIVKWRFDRVDKIKWNEVEIIDYKTGWKNINNEKIFSLQLIMYALALKQMHYEPKIAYLFYIEKWIKQECDINEINFNEAEKQMRESVKWIREWDYSAKPEKNKCKFCQFNRSCGEAVNGL